MILFLFLGEKKERERERKWKNSREKYPCQREKRTLVINYMKQSRHPVGNGIFLLTVIQFGWLHPPNNDIFCFNVVNRKFTSKINIWLLIFGNTLFLWFIYFYLHIIFFYLHHLSYFFLFLSIILKIFRKLKSLK